MEPLDTHPTPGAQLSSLRQVFGDERGLCPLYPPTPSHRAGPGLPGFAANGPPLSLTSSLDIHSPSLHLIISIPAGTPGPLQGKSSQGTFWPGPGGKKREGRRLSSTSRGPSDKCPVQSQQVPVQSRAPRPLPSPCPSLTAAHTSWAPTPQGLVRS